MGFNERLISLEKKVDEILKRLDARVIQKAARYDEILPLLQNLNIDSKYEKKMNYTNGEEYLVVSYEIKPSIIKVDDNLETQCDKMYYTMNMLNLLDYDFVVKVQEEIEFLKMSKKDLTKN